MFGLEAAVTLREFTFLTHVCPAPSSLDVPSLITPDRVQPQACPQSSQLPGMSVILLLRLISEELPLVGVAYCSVTVWSEVVFKPIVR